MNPTCGPFLQMLAEELTIPILFVLGNHDFYHGSIAKVREQIARLAERYEKLHYLGVGGVVRLSDTTAVVGHDSWADGRYGDFFGGRVALNDFRLIADLRLPSKQAQLEKIRLLADDGVAHLCKVLPVALESYRHVVVVIHVPPFEGATWHQGAISSREWLPFFSCKVFGEALLEMVDQYPDRRVTVLCGHTHSPGEYRPRDNVVVLTGKAVYGRTLIQDVFEWE